MSRRVNDDRLKQVADEVVAEMELNHPVLSASELTYTPEWAKGQKVVLIQFEDGFEDIHIVLGPGYSEESIKDQLRKAIGNRVKPS